jgi:hypothetical protein
MSQPHTSRPPSRRQVLKGLGVALALPLLDCLAAPAPGAEPAGAHTGIPRRMLCIETNQGILPQHFFPEQAGRDYQPTPYLELLKDHLGDLTVFSGVSLPEVDGGHHAELCFLTGAGHPGQGGFRNSISLDQYAAERIGLLTRFPSLSLCIDNSNSLSFTGAGVMIPGEDKPARVFKRLFIQGTPDEVEAQVGRLREERSILDQVAERTKQLNSAVGAGDRDKLDQYFTSLRELEHRLVVAEEWERKPKPKVEAKAPQDINDRAAVIERTRTMFDLARLAFANDSTRLITLYINQDFVRPNIAGVTDGTHQLTHHGNQPEKLAMLSSSRMRSSASSQACSARSRRPRSRTAACSTPPWCSTAPTWARPTPTPTTTCRCCSPAAASSMAATSPSTARRTIRSPTST